MPDDILATMVANFPNLAGLSILAYVLWRLDQNSERRLDEQVKFLRSQLERCYSDSQGREAESEAFS